MKREPARGPWYREPWPWLLMAGPMAVVVAGAVTTYLAITTNDGLVDDDYYKQGLAVNRRSDREQRASELGVGVNFELSPGGRELRARLILEESAPLPQVLWLSVSHPTRSGFDQKLVLQHQEGRVYEGAVSPLPEGRWRVSLEDEQHEWRVVGEWLVGNERSLAWMPVSMNVGGR